MCECGDVQIDIVTVEGCSKSSCFILANTVKTPIAISYKSTYYCVKSLYSLNLMGQLPFYKDFKDKNQKFTVDQRFNKIDTIERFDEWYETVAKQIRNKSENTKLDKINTDNMFRGMGEAKYKLLTSSQRTRKYL